LNLLLQISTDKGALKAIIDAPDFAQELSSRLNGIIFLGTPHRGSSSADIASVVTGVVNVAARFGSLGLAQNPLQQEILKDLKTGSRTLSEIHDTFSKRASQLQVKSFYETNDTVIRGKALGLVSTLPLCKKNPFLKPN